MFLKTLYICNKFCHNTDVLFNLSKCADTYIRKLIVQKESHNVRKPNQFNPFMIG